MINNPEEFVLTVANSHCPEGGGWEWPAVYIALIIAVTIYNIIKVIKKLPPAKIIDENQNVRH